MLKPQIITTTKPLPFDALEPLEFERLALWLVEREGYLRPQHLGDAGSEQGRDVVAYKQTDAGEELWYFQCKRYQKISAKTFKDEVDKYNDLAASDPMKKCVGIVFITNARLSANAREDVDAYCKQHGYQSDFWARTELDMRVKKYPEIVKEFFYTTQTPVYNPLHQIPAPPKDFTGRTDEIAELMREIEGGCIITGVQGMGGIGKTALAYKLAEKLKEQYADAQIYLDLRGASDAPLKATDAMAYVIHAFLPELKLPEDETAIRGIYNSVLNDKRVLLLMDNASDRTQVEPLTPPEGCFLLITSRQHFTLPGLFAKDLQTLSIEESKTLLLTIAKRIAEQAETIAKLCGCLPLALRLAASALAERKDLSVADYIRRLEDKKQRLQLIEASLSLSYELLDEEKRKLWRALGVFPETFDRRAATAIWQIDEDTAQDALSEFVIFSLLDWDEKIERYNLHDLARVFADSHLSEEERYESQKQHSTHYNNILAKTRYLYLEGNEKMLEGLNLFDKEQINIQAGFNSVANKFTNDTDAARLCMNYPYNGAYVLILRQHPRERIEWLMIAAQAARKINDRQGEGKTLGNLGVAYSDLGETRKAIEFYEQALIIIHEIGDRWSEGKILGNLGLAYTDLGETRKAIEFHKQQLIIVHEIGDRRSEGNALGSLGLAYADLGETRKAIGFHEQYLSIAREIGDHRGEGNALDNLGLAYSDLGETRKAIKFYEKALIIARKIGDHRGEGNSLINTSLSLYKLGNQKQAIENAEAALKIFEETESPYTEKVRRQLAEWREKEEE